MIIAELLCTFSSFRIGPSIAQKYLVSKDMIIPVHLKNQYGFQNSSQIFSEYLYGLVILDFLVHLKNHMVGPSISQKYLVCIIMLIPGYVSILKINARPPTTLQYQGVIYAYSWLFWSTLRIRTGPAHLSNISK